MGRIGKFRYHLVRCDLPAQWPIEYLDLPRLQQFVQLNVFPRFALPSFDNQVDRE